jgi:anti-sigma regulatory factor (Ser/Thr protein kinase)
MPSMRHLWIAPIVVVVVLLIAAAVITVTVLPAALALVVAVVALIAGVGTRVRHRPDRRARTATVLAADDIPGAASGGSPLTWSIRWDTQPPVDVLPETRRRATVVLAEWGLTGEEVEPALLVVTELLTNAMEHGGGPGLLSLSLADGAVHVRVHDHAPDPPNLRPLDPLQVRGRGLHLVEALSSRWGWSDDPPGKVVWAEVPTRWPA